MTTCTDHVWCGMDIADVAVQPLTVENQVALRMTLLPELARVLAKEPAPEFRDGHIYFIQGVQGGPVKIGFTENAPHGRLYALQTGYPDRLQLLGVLLGSKPTERLIQQQFKQQRVYGEWFEDSADLRAFIKTYTHGYHNDYDGEWYGAAHHEPYSEAAIKARQSQPRRGRPRA